MALEVASVLPPRANVLDVGCGNGFIAHHLKGMLGPPWLDWTSAAAPQRESITCLTMAATSGEGPELRRGAALLRAASRAGSSTRSERSQPRVTRWRSGDHLRRHSDNLVGPRGLLDARSAMAWPHWTMHVSAEHDWRRMFSLAGFEIVKERPLSRWRNLAHPVARRFFVIQATHAKAQRRKKICTEYQLCAFAPFARKSTLAREHLRQGHRTELFAHFQRIR